MNKLYHNELNPGQVKDIGPSTFYRVSAKPDLTYKIICDIRKWMSENLTKPFAVQKGYTNKSFKTTGSLTSQAYVFYIQSDLDYVIFKLIHGEYLE